MHELACLVTLVLLAGCSGMTTANRPCYVDAAYWNADDPTPFARMEVLNTGASCLIAVFTDRRAVNRQGTIIAQPAHGQARMRRTPMGLAAEYTPEPSFSGADSFRFSAGPGAPAITVDVTVRAKP